jgi:integrase
LLSLAVTHSAGVAGDFEAHSLRAGFVTSAATRGVPEVAIQDVTGHKSVTVLRGYYRRATPFENAPLRSIFGSDRRFQELSS